jgi:hypothetical protein
MKFAAASGVGAIIVVEILGVVRQLSEFKKMTDMLTASKMEFV